MKVPDTSSGSFQTEKDSVIVETKVILDKLTVPWEILWGPDNTIWYTQQDGLIAKVDPKTGKQTTIHKIEDIYRRRLGLLSMAIAPDFKKKPYVFVHYTTIRDSVIYARLVRFNYKNDRLLNPKVLLEYPAYYGHMGSRIVITKEDKIFLATGDGKALKGGKSNAQDLNNLEGKVLRLNLDGSIPSDNPIKGSLIWAWGFRVPQGLTLSPKGNLYTAEHGPAVEDEVNLILPGMNYGWRDVKGVEPLVSWTPTIAPAALTYQGQQGFSAWRNSLLLVTLKTQSFRVLNLNENGDKVISEKVYLANQFGRLRNVCVSPSGDVFVTTSNKDWNPPTGFPKASDDQILQLIPQVKKVPFTLKSNAVNTVSSKVNTGQVLFQNFCASCHKNDGTGIVGTFPSLKNNSKVQGDKTSLIGIVVNGYSSGDQKYDTSMPSFSFLKDNEIADILTYVRSNFENKATPITQAEVSGFRK